MLGYPIHDKIQRTLKSREASLTRYGNLNDNPYSPASKTTKKILGKNLKKTTYS